VMSRIVGSEDRLLHKKALLLSGTRLDNLGGGELLPKCPLRGSALSLTRIVGFWK
jgi:hypothetical protein